MIRILFLIIILVYLLPSYPKPVVIEDFVTEEERAHIMTEAKSKLHTSTVDKQKTIDENIRKSETAWLSTEDPVVRTVVERCVERIDRPIENCEHLQVLRYKPGGYYQPHQDAFFDEENVRLYTFVLALNDEYEDGETVFPNLKEKYKLRPVTHSSSTHSTIMVWIRPKLYMVGSP
jgi:hypothetical protein